MIEILQSLMEKSFTVNPGTKEPAGFGFIFVMILIISSFTIIATQIFIQIKNIVEIIVSWRKKINERKIEELKSTALRDISHKLDEVLDDLYNLKNEKQN